MARLTRKHKAWLTGNLIYVVLSRHFPNVAELIGAFDDQRNQDLITYTRYDLVMTTVFLFIFKMESRNHMNLTSNDEELKRNVEKSFNIKIPHMDTVNNFFKDLDPEQLEKMLTELVRVLIQKKILRAQKQLDGSFAIVFDGSGDGAATEHDEGTLKKVSKNGKETFSRSILVASIVTPNGFSIPIGIEWIATEDGASKQDCELNASKRLAKKIKGYFPKLNICLIADALYANATVFELCEKYKWQFLVTVKEKLSTVNKKAEQHSGCFQYTAEIDGNLVSREVFYCKNIGYQAYPLNWLRTFELDKNDTELQFTYVTSIDFNPRDLPEFVSIARSRWNIEDTFNTLKNRGIGGLHKFSRRSFNAYKNRRLIMLISQIIEQLVVMAKDMSKIFDRANDTFKNLWASLVSYLAGSQVDKFECHPRRKISYPL